MEIKVGTKEWYDSLRNKSLSSGFGKISDEAISLVIYEYNKSTKKNLSDLEIVQKALDKTGGRLTYHHSNGWAVEDESSDLYFRNSGSLLTWAKQTMSDIKDSSV